MVKSLAVDVLWKEYKDKKNDALRNQLVMSYLGLVKQLAGRLAVRMPSFMTQEDLESCGVFGLMEAVEKYDLDQGIDFETYAYRRIRGSMIDEIRKANWLPRTMWQKLQEFQSVKEKLEKEERYTEEALSRELGIGLQDLRKLEFYYHRAFSVSLDENLVVQDSNGVKLSELIKDPGSPDPFELFLKEEGKLALAEAIESLTEKEKMLLALYYQDGLNLREIGVVLGVSESRVCQIHGRAIGRLRNILTQKDE
jgi:RNA polymerase sigma factor for flagellar operon FliA